MTTTTMLNVKKLQDHELKTYANQIADEMRAREASALDVISKKRLKALEKLATKFLKLADKSFVIDVQRTLQVDAGFCWDIDEGASPPEPEFDGSPEVAATVEVKEILADPKYKAAYEQVKEVFAQLKAEIDAIVEEYCIDRWDLLDHLNI